ncbi:MAG: ABC transporter permease subunit [Anaerolineae bacterium]|nr:ABC transporter permease subunit [Anaerolineae bacterium]
MAGAVFMETLRQQWRQVIWWGLGLFVLDLYILIIIPDVDMLEQMADFVSTMPPLFMQFFGLSGAASLATPTGFIALLYGFVLLILVAWAVLSGLNVTSNEEDEGTLDMLLSLPIPRWRVVVEKYLVFAVLGLVMLTLGYLGLMAGLQVSTLEIDTGRVLEMSLGMLPSLLCVVALTVFLSALLKRRAAAVGLVTAIVVGSYVLNFLAESAPDSIFYSLRYASLFNYYKGEAIMLDGLSWGNVGVVLAATLVLLAGSLWAFQRRDVAV